MTEEQQRIAIAEFRGWKGCTDPKCDYRKAMHLHKNEVIAFPESYSIPRFPDYLNDLNAMHEAEKMMENDSALRLLYIENLERVTQCPFSVSEWYCTTATAAQRAEALLRTIGKWVES